MFLLTGVSHFIGMRAALVAMVPPALPAPELLITLTGVAELAGAAGLLWRPTVLPAAAGLSALLIGMFPANIYAAVSGWKPLGTTRSSRGPVMQATFLAATLTVLVDGIRRAERSVGHRGGARPPGRLGSVRRVRGPELLSARPGQQPGASAQPL